MNLFYLAEPRFGGWVTFTAHLALALRAAGYEVELFRVSARSEPRLRDFGRGLAYRNISLDDARLAAALAPSIITAAGPKFAPVAAALLEEGALIVIHDPTELKPAMVEALSKTRQRIVVIRESNLSHVKKLGLEAVFVPHPYVRMARKAERDVHAVAYSRLDWDKHTLVITEANTLLPPDKCVHIYGAENRMYTHHKVDKAFPEWRSNYRGQYAPEVDAPVKLASRAKFVVDMSAIAGDGDGTQYTFLEAWDAGAALVVNRAWIRTGKGAVRHDETAIAVENAQELAEVLAHKGPPKHVVAGGEAQLAEHEPRRIGKLYAAELRAA
jgi:hypothetical protein